MAAPVEEFKFKLAKAKDLPPSWFELVLVPNKFEDHLRQLHSNKQLEPSALSLIAIFLEKAGSLEGQTNSETSKFSDDRKKELIDSALFVGSFLEWDLPLLEKGLPPAVVYSLLTALINAHPLPPSPSSPSPALTAHLLYHLWVIRFAINYYTVGINNNNNTVNKGLTLWEGTCANIETIRQLVLPDIDTSISFLLSQVENTDITNYPSPSTHLTLSTFTTDSTVTISLPAEIAVEFSKKHIHIQVFYDLGQILFDKEDYSKSLTCFQSCIELYDKERGERGEKRKERGDKIGKEKDYPYPNIDRDRLTGYISACSSFDVSWVGGGEGGGEERNVIADIEQLRKHGEDSNMDTTLMLDLSSLLTDLPTLPPTYRSNLSLDISDWSDFCSTEPSSSKRSRLEGVAPVGVASHYELWRLVASVIEGIGVEPVVINKLKSNLSKEKIEMILNVINSYLSKDNSSVSSLHHLKLFIKSLDIPRDLLDGYPLINGLLINKDTTCIQIVKDDDISHTPFISGSHDPLTRLIPILVSSNPDHVKNEMVALHKEDPSIGNTLRGEGKSYLGPDQLKNTLLVAQHNMLIQKAEYCVRKKDYLGANEFYSSAAQCLNKSLPNTVRHGLIPMLMEQSLRMRILTASDELKKLSNKQACEKYSSLIEEARSHYGNSKAPHRDQDVTTLTGVFLLNVQQYNYVARCDRNNLHERIVPRLAVVAQTIQEGQDLRRCTRELFETITAVFSSGNSAKGGGSDKQSSLKRYLELISIHLQDLICLSYLMAAIARLWNIVAKPEYEITMEYTGQWPTAVGHSSSINNDTVLRTLQLLVSHSLSLLPSYSSWLIIQGDIYMTTGDYSSSLRYYLEAGAHESDLYETNVPDSVWTKQVYHRMIDCCLNLKCPSHALIIAQMMEPFNFTFTLSLLKDNIQYLLEDMFEYLWDMSVIEILIYNLSKNGDVIKRTAAINVAGKPELNTSNSTDILVQAKTDLICLSYLMAAIARLWNIIAKPEYDITMEYTGQWPTAVGHSSSINNDTVLRTLQLLVSHSLSLLPSYSSWLIIQGDIYMTTGDYSSSLRYYLEAGAHESDLYETNVPDSVWTKQVYHRMIDCCLNLKCPSHALIIAQMMEPFNFTFTLSLLKDNIQYLLEDMFEYLWDMSVIETLIYNLSKNGDVIKRTAAINVAGKPELNTSNSTDILVQAKTVRRRTFLRNLYTSIIDQTL